MSGGRRGGWGVVERLEEGEALCPLHPAGAPPLPYVFYTRFFCAKCCYRFTKKKKGGQEMQWKGVRKRV